MSGTLSKWTNYLHGWQDRFFALKPDGSLVYYKSSVDTDFGCRGAIHIQKARVRPHDLDELRFDVSVNDCNWYLRASTAEDRKAWVHALQAHGRMAQHPPSATAHFHQLNRHGSAQSLSSNSFSGSSRPGGSARGRGLTEKLAEMETFRDILCRQVDTLQTYFDSCAEVAEAAGLVEGAAKAQAREADSSACDGDVTEDDRASIEMMRAAHPSLTREVLLQVPV